ncbi:CENP-B N-terminal DNA-binding domain [Popillia japonica]|uniref:CENP-B N-terminal DNA-binding domain n=1 Tax=Popillia japonica TaxID=7064 RepID=A0AAW1IF26_POPJA
MNRSYTNEDLEEAVSAVRVGGLSIREAERTYQVPFNTIRRRVNGSVDMNCKRAEPQPLLGTECEKNIYEAVLQLVNGSVDMNCKRAEPQPLLGTECEKNIYEAVLQLQKNGIRFE